LYVNSAQLLTFHFVTCTILETHNNGLKLQMFCVHMYLTLCGMTMFEISSSLVLGNYGPLTAQSR